MKKRIAALFMAVVLCTGTMNLPVSATEVSVPEGQKTAEVSIPEGELPGEEKSTVSDEAAITEDSTDSGSEVEAADDASAPGTDGKSEEPDGILTESEDNGEQTPSDGEEDGAVPVLEAGQEGVPSKAPAISQENATDPTSDVPAEKDPALAGGVVSEEKEPEKPTELEVLQSRIDALPDADALAEMDEDSIKAVYDEFLAISDAWEALDEEEAESLNMDRLYEVAAYFSGQVATLEETDTDVAQISDITYSSLSEAVQAANDADSAVTIDLLKDIELSSDLVIGASHAVTLNLNGHILNGKNSQVCTQNAGLVTITGGELKNEAKENKATSYPLYIVSGSNVCLDAVKITGQYGVYTCGNLDIHKVEIDVNEYAIAVNLSAEVTIGVDGADNEENIKVSSKGNCISTQATEGRESMKVTIYGGTFISTNPNNFGKSWAAGPIYWASHGTLNIYDGIFKGSTNESSKVSAALYQKNGTVNIYGGMFEDKDALKLGAEETNCTEISMNVYGGNFTGDRSALYFKTEPDGLNCQKFEINISDGTFVGKNPQYYAIYASTKPGVIAPTVAISGGYFNESVEEKYCAKYYAPTELLANGMYSVKIENPVAQIGDVVYPTLNSAVVAAKAGDTIKMLADEKLGSPVVINKNLTLDLNGRSIIRGEGNETNWLLGVVEGYELTIQDSAGGGEIHSDNYQNSNDGKGYGVLTNGSVKVESGTVSGYYGVYVSGNNSSITVEDGTVKGSNIGINNTGGVIELTGGTVTGDSFGVFNTNGIANMKGGTVSGLTVGFIVSGNSAKLTMEGGTIQDAPGKGIQVQNGGTLHVKAGTIRSSNANGITSINDSTVIIEGGTIKSDTGNGMVLQSGTQLTMTGGEVTSAKNAVELTSSKVGEENKYSSATISKDAVIKGGVVGVFVGNIGGDLKCTLEIAGGNIFGGGYAVSGNGSQDNTEITISGGILTSDNLGIFHPQAGDLTITGGTITAPNGVQYCGSGNLTITGGTIRATGAYSESPTKPSDQGDGSADDGAALSLISRGGGYQEAGTSMNVTIGGTAELISENNAAIAVYRLQKLTGNWVINDSTTLSNYLGSLSITGGHLSGGSQKGAFEIDGKAKEAVKVSGGYFSSDPTEYVAAGSAALDGHWVQSGENYYFTIGAIPDAMKIAQNPVQLANADTSDMTTEDKAFVESFEEQQDSITHSSLTKIASDLANKELDSQMDSLKTQGMEALKELQIIGADQNMTLYLMPYMDMKIIDADAAANTLTLDITAKYNLYASTASTASEVKVGTNAVVLKEAEVMENITSKVDITVPLPGGFKTVNLKVKHIKENGQKELHYYYTPEVNTDSKGKTVATFTNPHGFSTFILTSDERTATVEYQMADGTKQKVTYTANDVGVTKLPADSKPYHTFIGWKFPGDETVYGPSELTDDLLDKLSASGNTIIATPEFAAVTADINITKDVTDSDGKALRVDGSFYAAVFTDKDCTVRYGQIVELKLQNASRTTASVTVGVPEDGSKVTYYVAETDKNGKVVQSGEAFGYQVTLTGNEAVVSDGQKAEVGIVNRKLRSEVPAPDENPSSHSGGKKHHSSSDSSPTAEVSPVAPATTGDSTNMLIPVLCLLIGAGGIGSFMFARKKKKSVK